MSRLPLPRANPVLLGQQAAEDIFLQAWRSGRVPHAWILSGPKGVGKATLAYRMARFVLASGEKSAAGGLFGSVRSEAGSLSLDPAHPVFIRVASGGHSDLRTVERAVDEKRGRVRSEIVIDDVRALGGFLALTPAEGSWRVAIVDEAECMNRNAENAILKSLEEPPKNTLIILISNADGRLLPTIRSRCCQVRLPLLSDPVVSELLRSAHPDLSDEDHNALLRLGRGSIGRCLDLLDQGGIDLYRRLQALLQTLPTLDFLAAYAFVEHFGRGDEPETWGVIEDLFTGWLARLVRTGATGVDEPEILSGENAQIRRLLNSSPLEHWLMVWEKAGQLFAKADSLNLERKQVLLSIFSALEPPALR